MPLSNKRRGANLGIHKLTRHLCYERYQNHIAWEISLDQLVSSKNFNVRNLLKPGLYCLYDVTKIQTKKLSILPRFYFHDALEPRELKTNFQTNFRFKRVLGFVIEYS